MRTFSWPYQEERGFWFYAYPIGLGIIIVLCIATGIFTCVKRKELVKQEDFDKFQKEREMPERTKLNDEKTEV